MKKSVTMPVSLFRLDSNMSLTKIRVLAALMALAKNGVVSGKSQREIASVIGVDAIRAHMTIKSLVNDGLVSVEPSPSGGQTKIYTVLV